MGEMEASEEQVMSDVHLGCPSDCQSCLTVFTISPPVSCSAGDLEHNIDRNGGDKVLSSCQQFTLDKEGDLVLPRRKSRHENVRITHDSVLIHHHVTTVMPSVGLQVWKASLLLADFILHTVDTSSRLNDVVALELGAGTGLVGILLARVARTVFITDRGEDILNNCFHNVELNFHTCKYNTENSVRVRELDWQNPWPSHVIQAKEGFLTSHEYKYAWSSQDIGKVEEASILVAADVVYSNELTDAFFKVLRKLIPAGSEKVLFLSLEKRYNFTLEDLDIVAHGYAHFRKYIDDTSESTGHARCSPIPSETDIGTLPYFTGKCLDVARVPQYIRQYNRGNDLELWEIRARPPVELKVMSSSRI